MIRDGRWEGRTVTDPSRFRVSRVVALGFQLLRADFRDDASAGVGLVIVLAQAEGERPGASRRPGLPSTKTAATSGRFFDELGGGRRGRAGKRRSRGRRPRRRSGPARSRSPGRRPARRSAGRGCGRRPARRPRTAGTTSPTSPSPGSGAAARRAASRAGTGSASATSQRPPNRPGGEPRAKRLDRPPWTRAEVGHQWSRTTLHRPVDRVPLADAPQVDHDPGPVEGDRPPLGVERQVVRARSVRGRRPGSRRRGPASAP